MTVFSPGQRLHDRFTLRERLGRGGMSEVWRATDELLGRDVAVKVLLSPLRADPAMREAMWREARAAARIRHPGVTQVHDYGEVPLPGGETAGYLVMELIEGESLARRLTGGPLPWREAVRVGAQVAAALAAAHKLGVVHRDIKPGNVMLTDDGVKVLDFGIAAVAGHVGDDPGRLLGTPRYAAPERFHGGAPEPASDVYSLGVLLYEALAGPPADPPGSLPEAAAAAGTPPPPLTVAGLPEPVADLCRRCRSPDPARRPAAAEVATVLAEAAGTPVPAAHTLPLVATAPPPTPAGSPPGQTASAWPAGRAEVGRPGGTPATRVDPAPPTPRRGGRLALAAVGVVVLLVLGLVLVVALRPDESGTSAGPGTGTGPGAGPSAAPDPGTPPAPATVTGGLERVLADLEQAVTQLLSQGAVATDTAEDLRDHLADMREAMAEPPGRRERELREEAADLREEIEGLRVEGALDPLDADRLNDLLAPLLAS